jgi:hypothetical protein
MSMFDDYLMRMIKQLSEAIASIVRKLRGGDTEDAARALHDAYDALLEHNRSFLDMVDANSLAILLGSPDKVRLLAQLSWLDAELARARGDTAAEARLRQRAEQLRAIAMRDAPAEGDTTLFDALTPR